MPILSTIHLLSPGWLIAASVLGVVAVALLWAGSTLPIVARICLTIALILLVVASGLPEADRNVSAKQISVLVDLSPSTRGATYRDGAQLRRRLAELLHGRPYERVDFTDATPVVSSGTQAIVLFGDGRAAFPDLAPPTFVVIDPALDNPPDARVTDLGIRDGDVHAAFVNTGNDRTLAWTGVSNATAVLKTSSYSVVVKPSASRVAVQISPGDLWPENDSLAINLPPPQRLERWWIGQRRPGQNWTYVEPSSLAVDTSSLLNAGVVVLDNVPAASLSLQQQSLLDSYVRDLGGTLIILGGDHAFAAGGYVGTVLDALSPLSGVPPTPTTEWTILIDASGSMATAALADRTRFDTAVAAALAMLNGLPPADSVAIGSFANDVHWWSTGKTVRETQAMKFPPADVTPTGPTNLTAAINAVVGNAGGKSRRVLLITDAGAKPPDVEDSVRRFKASSSSLNLLAIGSGPATDALASVSKGTGGVVLSEANPAKWSRVASELLAAASPEHVRRQSAMVKFFDALAGTPPTTTETWNQLWPRKGAMIVATRDQSTDPMAAWWAVGVGRVASLAFGAEAEVVGGIATALAVPPRDDRFAVTWASDHVTVVATDAGQPMNMQPLSLSLTPGNSKTIPQTAPGRYELSFSPPQQPALAVVRLDSRVIARRAIAGRYALEFAAIGNDYTAMRQIAERTGGQIVEPTQHDALDLPTHASRFALSPWLAIAGAISLVVSLVLWRRTVR